MKTKLILLLVAVVMSTSIFAQKPQKKVAKTPEEIATKKSTSMKKLLTLTNEQTKEIYDIYLKSAKESSKIREEMKKLMTEKRNLRKECKVDIESELNPEQISKLEALKIQERNNKKGHGKHKGKNKGKKGHCHRR